MPLHRDRVGGPRNDDRRAGKGTASPEFGLDHLLRRRHATRNATTKTAVEMTSLWKPKSGSHRDLEISHSTRDSHISTADHFTFIGEEKKNGSDPLSDQLAAGLSHPRPHSEPARIIVANRQK